MPYKIWCFVHVEDGINFKYFAYTKVNSYSKTKTVIILIEGPIHKEIDVNKASGIGQNYLNHQRPYQGKCTKFRLHEYSQPSDWHIVSLRYRPQFNPVCSLYLNKGSYPDWRHDSCSVEMSLILFLYNEAIILYNLGQPEGTAIKYSGLMGGEWCTRWAGSLKGRREENWLPSNLPYFCTELLVG